MAYDDDHRGPGKSIIEREITEGVVRARKAVNRYLSREAELGQRNRDPQTDADLYSIHRLVHVSTLNAFDMMRDYIKEDTTGIWNKSVVGEDATGRPIVLGSKPLPKLGEDGTVTEERFEDVRFLDEWYTNAIRSQTHEKHVRFEGLQEVTDYHLDMLDIVVYKNTANELMNVLRKTEFAPLAPEPTIESEPLAPGEGYEQV